MRKDLLGIGFDLLFSVVCRSVHNHCE